MIKDGKIFCGNCEKEIENENESFFVDTEEGSFELCCWGCVADFAAIMRDK